MDKNSYNVRLSSWARMIVEASNSGLPKTKWCQQNNIKIRQFHYWQRKIRDYVLEHPDVSAEDLCDSGHGFLKTQNSPSFYELSCRQMSSIQKNEDASIPPPPEPSAIPQAPALMLQFDRFRLYIGDGFTESTLSSVIKVIRNA